MVNLSYQVSNLSMSIAIIYTQHYIITTAIPILNHQRGGFVTKEEQKKKRGT